MISIYTRKILVLLITLTLAAVITLPASAQAIVINGRFIDLFQTRVTACNGEEVFLSGEILVIYQTTTDALGGIHSKSTLVANQIRGVGSLTGTEYQALGGGRSHINQDTDTAPYIFSNTNMFNVVSQAGTDNLRINYTLHMTINPNGEVTAQVDQFSSTCVG